MKGSAQRDVLPGGDALETVEFQLTEPHAELKRQVAERLAAHRQRRGEPALQVPEGAAPRRTRRHAAATAVAERYAQTPSYRAFLAEQAQRAMEEAAAAAEIARRNAEAVAAVQQELLTELEAWDVPQKLPAGQAAVLPAAGSLTAPAGSSDSVRRVSALPGLTVRLYEDLGPSIGSAAPMQRSAGPTAGAADLEEVQALEAEIDFRKNPVFEDYKAFLDRDVEPPTPLPANLLEFPRQLVAARKARPRLAEGPLRDEAPRTQQLRIFEVEAEQISTAPLMSAPAAWTSIRLDGHSAVAPAESPVGAHMAVLAAALPPQTAPMALRLMAGLVDLGLVLAALVAFAAVFVQVTGTVLVGQAAGLALGLTAAALYLVYELLFFTFSDQTPGMRYAQIGLCTFSDENPARAAIRRRILAQLVAVLPAGLGLVWSLLDDEGLGWHDRISRMYPRAY